MILSSEAVNQAFLCSSIALSHSLYDYRQANKIRIYRLSIYVTIATLPGQRPWTIKNTQLLLYVFAFLWTKCMDSFSGRNHSERMNARMERANESRGTYSNGILFTFLWKNKTMIQLVPVELFSSV